MITREEYLELKELYNDGYRWIARDENGYVYVYYGEPKKLLSIWKDSEDGGSSCCLNKYVFPYIKWEDEKPTKINDIIRDYDSHLVITEGNNLNKAELIKEIKEILDDIGVCDYELGECDEDTIWTISSITIREIFSAIEKHSPVSVSEKVKVTVPQFVADWIEEVKALKRSFKLEILFDTTEMPDDVYDWLDERYGDTDILAKAWLDGYVVEKEELYTVRLKNGYHLCKYEGTGVR